VSGEAKDERTQRLYTAGLRMSTAIDLWSRLTFAPAAVRARMRQLVANWDAADVHGLDTKPAPARARRKRK
jgi:hypothetical protein